MADVYEDRSRNFISHEGVQRKIVVQCNVSGRDLLGVVDEIEVAVAAQVKLPRGGTDTFDGRRK